MWLAAETVALALAGITYAQEPSFLGERGQGVRLSNLSGESLPVVRVEANDELARGRLEQLMRRSGTVREMLGTLHDSRHVFVALRSSKDLWRLTGLDGRGTLRVAAGRIAADVEFDPRRSPEKQLRSIAHELAHAVEIASAKGIDSTDKLREYLQAASSRRLPGVLKMRDFETPFAINVEDRVARELRANDALDGQLRALAARHGIDLR